MLDLSFSVARSEDHRLRWNRREFFCRPIDWDQIDRNRPPRLDDVRLFGVANGDCSRSFSKGGETNRRYNFKGRKIESAPCILHR